MRGCPGGAKGDLELDLELEEARESLVVEVRASMGSELRKLEFFPSHVFLFL